MSNFIEGGFEVGKYYEHFSSFSEETDYEEVIYVLSKVETYFYGKTFLAETTKGRVKPIGVEESFTLNYKEVSEERFEEVVENMLDADIEDVRFPQPLGDDSE